MDKKKYIVPQSEQILPSRLLDGDPGYEPGVVGYSKDYLGKEDVRDDEEDDGYPAMKNLWD